MKMETKSKHFSTALKTPPDENRTATDRNPERGRVKLKNQKPKGYIKGENEMTTYERVKQALRNYDFDDENGNGVNELIAFAYFLGKCEKSKE